MWSVLCFILISLNNVFGDIRIDPLVETKRGLIRGQKAKDGDYSMFLGIPYAKINDSNPFGLALPQTKFEKTFLANDDSSKCPQIDEFTNEVIGTLDCLHLHVYVPSIASSRNRLPVLVWLHGGAFKVGYAGGYFYGAKYLVRHDVIVVSLNYRLGPYGFMCLGTPEVPGNQGIKDQLIALRWINENIQYFGGDVNKITIMGESAGSASIEYHLMSKQETLFNKAIMQSGTNLKPGGIPVSDITPPLKLSEKLGFKTNNIAEAITFLAPVAPGLVIKASSDLSLNFRGCVEKELENIEHIITEHPFNIAIPKLKGMPILAGFNDREALMMDAYKSKEAFEKPNYFKETLELMFEYDEEFQHMVDIVRHYYIGDEDFSAAVRNNIIQFESDFYYNYPIQWSFRKYLQNGASKVYPYLFSYDGGRNFFKNRLNITLAGAAHADELGYLFDMSYDQKTPSEEDQLVIDRITTLWTNFVKYGNPTPELSELLPVEWPALSEDTYTYLNIGQNLTLERRPFHASLAFWELFFKTNQNRLKGYDKNNNL